MWTPGKRASVLTGLLAVAAMAPPTAAAQEVRPLERTPPRTPEGASEPQGLLAEPGFIQRLTLTGDRRLGNGELTQGFYIESGNMIPGSGRLAAGPGYRKWYGKDHALADASAAISWKGYKVAQARAEFPGLLRSRLTAGGQFRWQDFPQMAYYGEGQHTAKSNRSEYRFQSSNLVGYAIFRPVRWLGLGASAGWLQPSIDARGGFFKKGGVPDTRTLFANNPVFAASDEPAFIHTELSMTADTRDFAGHPTRGGLYRVAAANFADRDAGAFSFRRYEAEAAQFIPLAQSRLVVAVHGWLVGSDTSQGETVPFYLQPALGGGSSLRGFADYRFHDRHLLQLNVEGRVALMTHVDAAVFMDAGNVAARAGDLDLDKRSYGAGLRLHSRRQTFLRADVARGGEGWRLVLNVDDPFNLARLAKRTAAAPFAH